MNQRAVPNPVADDENASLYLHDSREPLECCPFKQAHRGIGVVASTPFHDYVRNIEIVDISRETILVNTQTFGGRCPVEDADIEIQSATEATVADLDKVISELVAHRDRLTASRSTNPRSPRPTFRTVPTVTAKTRAVGVR